MQGGLGHGAVDGVEEGTAQAVVPTGVPEAAGAGLVAPRAAQRAGACGVVEPPAQDAGDDLAAGISEEVELADDDVAADVVGHGGWWRRLDRGVAVDGVVQAVEHGLLDRLGTG